MASGSVIGQCPRCCETGDCISIFTIGSTFLAKIMESGYLAARRDWPSTRGVGGRQPIRARIRAPMMHTTQFVSHIRRTCGAVVGRPDILSAWRARAHPVPNKLVSLVGG